MTKQSNTFEERCQAQAQPKMDEAAKQPPGPERDALERKATQMLNATKMKDFLSGG